MLRRDIRGEKNALRAKMKEIRRQMSPAEKEEKDRAIRSHLLSSSLYQNCQTLLTFVSSPIEVDTRMIIQEALAAGKKVGVPYCIDGTRQMRFYQICSFDDLAPRSFGVLEPIPQRCQILEPAGPSICIVPGLAFDPQGFRLGFGKGYYDRFLSSYKGTKIGVIYKACLCQQLPHGYYDVPVDLLISENGPKKSLPGKGRNNLK